MKSDLARLGVRNFNPKLKKAPEKLDAVRTPEGTPIPPNTIAKLKRDIERFRLLKEQIQKIEVERLERINKAPEEKAHAMIVLLARVLGMGIETADMLVREALSRNLRDRRAVARLGGLTGRQTNRLQTPRERACQGGLRAAAHGRDPIGLADGNVPEGLRSGSMVHGADSRWPPPDAKNHDRGACPQTAHRLLAHGDNRRNPRRHDLAASSVITVIDPIIT